MITRNHECRLQPLASPIHTNRAFNLWSLKSRFENFIYRQLHAEQQLSISKFEWIIFIDFLLFFLLQKGVHKLHAKGALE